MTASQPDPDPRAFASMTAFDAMPEEFRRFCADYPRTAAGGQLMKVLDHAGWDVERAKRVLRSLLPV